MFFIFCQNCFGGTFFPIFPRICNKLALWNCRKQKTNEFIQNNKFIFYSFINLFKCTKNTIITAIFLQKFKKKIQIPSISSYN